MFLAIDFKTRVLSSLIRGLTTLYALNRALLWQAGSCYIDIYHSISSARAPGMAYSYPLIIPFKFHFSCHCNHMKMLEIVSLLAIIFIVLDIILGLAV